jgi:hypothetical protein
VADAATVRARIAELKRDEGWVARYIKGDSRFGRTADDWRAQARFVTKRFGDRAYAVGQAGVAVAFAINIHLGEDAEWKKQWNEQVRQRELAMGKPAIDLPTPPPVEDPNPDLH